jgi:hypothetical protein
MACINGLLFHLLDEFYIRRLIILWMKTKNYYKMKIAQLLRGTSRE